VSFLISFTSVSYLQSRGGSIACRDAARVRKKDEYRLIKGEKQAAIFDRRKGYKEKEGKASNHIGSPSSSYAER
jgi:hypothetical protein